MTNVSDNADLVVLLDANGQVTGTSPRSTVHTSTTPLHLGFSCYLVNQNGEILLTRRSLTKQTWAGVWTNTCCGHPRPREPIDHAVRRRLLDELGIEVKNLELVIEDFAYTATDSNGIVEHELCPVFLAWDHRQLQPPTPDEVMATEWVQWSALHVLASTAPWAISPWCAQQVRILGPHALAHLRDGP
jgi:isopentenyl-diphosphate delta-isomerase type 1